MNRRSHDSYGHSDGRRKAKKRFKKTGRRLMALLVVMILCLGTFGSSLTSLAAEENDVSTETTDDAYVEESTSTSITITSDEEGTDADTDASSEDDAEDETDDADSEDADTSSDSEDAAETVNEDGTVTEVTESGSAELVTEDSEEADLTTTDGTYGGYISSLAVSIQDGTAPFDDEEDDGDDAGNDSSATNKSVRTFDDIIYTFSMTASSRTSTDPLEDCTIVMTATMEKDLTEAMFDIDSMTWVSASGSTWAISYYDDNDEVILTQTSSGLVDGDGETVSSFNNIAGGSSKEQSYGSEVVKQVLTATYQKSATGESSWSLEGLACYIEVLASKNGDTIQPEFSFYLADNDGQNANEENLDADNKSQEDTASLTGNKIDEITVTAAARYNLKISAVSTGRLSYVGYFDLDSGEESDSSDEDAVYGRIVGYGISIQLFNESNADILSEKGLKGVELPIGEISFDLNLSNNTGTSDLDEDDYTAYLWDYNENTCSNSTYTGHFGRNLYWYNSSSYYARQAAPESRVSTYLTGSTQCYLGGSWTINAITVDGVSITTTDDNDGTITGYDADLVTGDGSGATYSFTVSGFDFDFDDWHFPDRTAGASSSESAYANSYIGTFSAGSIQVLQTFPNETVEDTSITLKASVSNMTAKSLSSSVSEESERYGSYGGDENDDSNDNGATQSISIYVPGNMVRYHSVTAVNSTNLGSSFLGSSGDSYWSTNWDASAMIGSEVALWASVRLSSSDAAVYAANVLMLFDSEVFDVGVSSGYDNAYYWSEQIDSDGKGEADFLYVADPLYPGGYDTNSTTDSDNDGVSDVTERMNSVTEEDMLYFKSLDELVDAGYICIGVLMEVRECEVRSGAYLELKVPVTIRTTYRTSGETISMDSYTVALVSVARVWASTDSSSFDEMNEVTWANASNNYDGEANEWDNSILVDGSNVDLTAVTGYRQIQNAALGHNYIKTEYTGSATQVSGTHNPGHLYGMSLLLVGYEASIDIEVTNVTTNQSTSSSSSSLVFDYGEGQTTALYTLSNIKTVAGTTSGLGSEASGTTSLTITINLPGEAVYSATAGGIKITGCDENGEQKVYTISLSDSSDDDGTTIYYYDEDNVLKSYEIVAVMGDDNSSITFYLSDVTIGDELLNICIYTELTGGVTDGESYTATAKIAGEGDTRSFTASNNNYDSTTFYVTMLSGSKLSKSVESELVELGGDIVYTLTATNASDSSDYEDVTILDILPADEDYWGSDYDGTYTVSSVSITMEDNTYDAVTEDDDGSYALYSTESTELSSDNSYITSKAEEALENGELLSNSTYSFSIVSSNASKNDDEYTVTWSSLKLEATAVAVTLSEIATSESVQIKITLSPTADSTDTEDSEQDPGDVYYNCGYMYGEGNSGILVSNVVKTYVVGRTISGLVWWDADYDGVRDDDEGLISGVVCTLYKYNSSTSKYEVCTTDVEGNEISTVTTGSNGAYSFERLAAGSYIVVFSNGSGNVLSVYDGATTYQVNNENDSTTNDGVALSSTTSTFDTDSVSISGVSSGKYAIAYGMSGSSITAITGHTISEYLSTSSLLTDYVEAYTYQDLGLVVTDGELPKTGGPGRMLFLIFGVGLVVLAAAGYVVLNRRRRRVI